MIDWIIGIVSLIALYFAWRAWVIARKANKISEMSNQIAESSNLIAKEAKDISEKTFKIEEQKMKGEISQRKIEQREKIRPYFKCISLGRQGGILILTLTIKNSGNGSARYYSASIISEFGHKFQGGQPSHNLFRKDISHNIEITGDTGKPFILNLSFEDIEDYKYNQTMKYNGSVIDDEFPPERV